MSKRTYVTTTTAGYVVAGQRIPAVPAAKGDMCPKVGHELLLSDAEAEYELRQGTIAPKPEEPASEAKPTAKVTAKA